MALQNDLTNGSVQSHIIKFSLPLLLSNLFQALYNAVDMYFAGRYLGDAGICAVSVSGSVMNVLFMTIAGMSVGVSVTLGAYVGKNDRENILQTAGTAISLYAICALAVTVLGILLAPALLRLIATPIEALSMAIEYLRIIFAGMLFTLGYNLIGAFQRGFGDSRSSLLFVAVATVTNAVLDVLLMPSLGVRGAAYATILSQALSFVMGLVYFRYKKHIISFLPSAWKWNAARLQDLVRIGLPSALQQASLHVSNMALNGIVNTYGLHISTAYGIGVRIDSFAILPTNALNDAVASFTSQNLGAGQEARALNAIHAARRIALCINAVLTLLIVLFAPSLAALFTKDAAVIEATAQYLHITCIMYMLYAWIHPIIGFVKGSGNAMFTFTNGLQAQFLVRLPIALLLSKVAGLGFAGVAIAWICAPLYSNFTYAHFMRKEKWRVRVSRSQESGSAL